MEAFLIPIWGIVFKGNKSWKRGIDLENVLFHECICNVISYIFCMNTKSSVNTHAIHNTIVFYNSMEVNIYGIDVHAVLTCI